MKVLVIIVIFGLLAAGSVLASPIADPEVCKLSS